MSKYSTSVPKIPTTSDSEFNDYTENSETFPSTPTGENTNAVISLETAIINPPQSPSQLDSSNTPPSSPSTRNSKQNFLSLFKRKESISNANNASPSKAIPTTPQQLVVPTNSSIYNNKDTTEEISNNHFATEHNVSQSVIGSISVPNLTASNTDASLEAEYDALMKQQRFVIGNSDVSYGLGNGTAGGKTSNGQFKKSEKKKVDLVSTEKTDDKGFKNTMKNTMRKTSTFFKKLGNKQNPDNQLQRNVRLPLPDFQDVSNPQSPTSEELQDASSPIIDVTEFSNLDKNDETTLSNNDDDSDDEQGSLQRTLKDYASVYAHLQSDGENRRRSGSYRMSLLSANKSVPDNIGRTYEWNEQSSDNGNVDGQLTNNDPKREHSDDSSNTLLNSLDIKNEKEKVRSKQIVEVTKDKENNFEGQKNSKLNIRVNPNLSSRDELSSMDKRAWLLTKPIRPESVLGADSGLNPSKIPKRPDRKLPDIPKNVPASESDASQTRSPRQASSNASSYYETASGSSTTLHTAPPSPTTDALIESFYITDGTPKIQIDEFVLSESPIDKNFDRNSPPEVPENDEEKLWLKARIAAKKCYDEDETFIKKEEITKYLGGHELINSRALKFYMEYYDFSNLRLDEAFRRLCEKLYIKGETQQVDRILEAFSIRYWECNPKSIYGSSDIVHAIAYSILLLNTDLHVAQLASKMSRSQFVRNTMAAVKATQNQSIHESYEDDQSTITSIDTSTTGASATARPRRSGSVKSWRSNPSSFISGGRQWDSEIESLLKEMYSAIKLKQILQPISSSSDKPASSVETSNTPTLGLKRSRSHLGHPNYSNSRVSALKKGLSAGTSKGRKNANGRISPSPSSVSGGSDSSVGLDGSNRSGSSQTLPTTLSSFSLRHTSSSDTSTIPEMVDEHDPDDDDDRASVSTVESLSLYLSPPYAKEGLLVKKQYWESTNKRAKDKGWKECFVVIEKGGVKMYKFESNSSHNSMGLGAIGGGNWMANATLMGEVNLCHTITNALPPPGYNRSRPYVFALSLSNGGLYFFQAGTAELVNEWVATCNYWAARMSKEPLTGGVSSMEYGWGRCLVSLEGGEDLEDSRSIMSDGRSVLSANSAQASDRIVVSEWKAPIPPTMSSNFDEESQLAALKKYRADLEKELEEHKNYWEPMTKLFHSRSSNYTRAFSNWEKKSQWLLYEIVKYTTYIECINNSINIRSERRKEREKSKNHEDDKNKNDDTEEAKKEKKRARARQSIKLLHRATWTPGDGYSLNLPQELLFGGALSNLEEDDNEEDFLPNGKMKSPTYPLLYDKKVIIEEEQRIGNFNSSIDYDSGHKWVDRFA